MSELVEEITNENTSQLILPGNYTYQQKLLLNTVHSVNIIHVCKVTTDSIYVYSTK